MCIFIIIRYHYHAHRTRARARPGRRPSPRRTWRTRSWSPGCRRPGFVHIRRMCCVGASVAARLVCFRRISSKSVVEQKDEPQTRLYPISDAPTTNLFRKALNMIGQHIASTPADRLVSATALAGRGRRTKLPYSALSANASK